jgi:hypothetical protein
MKKGCIIAICSLIVLAVAGIVTIWVLADQYEKQPKKPGEAELWSAENFIRAYESSESSGNTPEAVAFADQFSRSLRVSRQFMFTEGKAGSTSISKGRFLTYCFLRDDSVAILVHVPELRRYTDDAKLTLEEFAWGLATSYAASKHPEVKKIALGVKGPLNYSAIITGFVNDKEPLKGIEVRHPTTSTKPLWPFFLSPKIQSEQAAPSDGEKPPK